MFKPTVDVGHLKAFMPVVTVDAELDALLSMKVNVGTYLFDAEVECSLDSTDSDRFPVEGTCSSRQNREHSQREGR